MSESHIEVASLIGSTVEDSVNFLLKCRSEGKLRKIEFNGVWLYSDTVTMDDAYLSITGRTKEELDKMQKEKREKWTREECEHNEKIPELTAYWIEEGNKVLPEDKKKLWTEVVPIRLTDLYRGMELKNTLDLHKVINIKTYENYSRARAMLNNQGHSGMSYSLVKAMVIEFSPNGDDFFDYIKRNGG